MRVEQHSQAQLIERWYHGPVEEKLAAARSLVRTHGHRLQVDARCTQRLRVMENARQALVSWMKELDMPRLCSECATRAGGGCCSGYMAANCDAILLLINMLAGIEVKPQHNRQEECCFLGRRGCILPFKPIFCLNYNCTHIHAAAGKQRMEQLEKKAAALLGEQTALESWLLDYLRSHHGKPAVSTAQTPRP